MAGHLRSLGTPELGPHMQGSQWHFWNTPLFFILSTEAAFSAMRCVLQKRVWAAQMCQEKRLNILCYSVHHPMAVKCQTVHPGHPPLKKSKSLICSHFLGPVVGHLPEKLIVAPWVWRRETELWGPGSCRSAAAPPVFYPDLDPSGISRLACWDAPNPHASPAAWLSPHTLERSANEEGLLRLIPRRGLLFLEWLFSILLDEIVRIESCAFKSNSFEGILSSRSNYFCSGVFKGGKAVNWERGTETHLPHQVVTFYPGGRRNFLIWVFFFFASLSKSNLVSFSIAKEEGTKEKLIRQEVNTTEGRLLLTQCVTLNRRACPKWLPSNKPCACVRRWCRFEEQFSVLAQVLLALYLPESLVMPSFLRVRKKNLCSN